jgi:hypothetical protein
MVTRYGIAVVLGSCALTAGVLAGGGSAQAAGAASCLSTYGQVAVPGQTADWRVVQSTKPSADLGQVVSAVAGPSNLWLFACSGVALHYAGGGWTSVPLPAGAPPNITTATASSASDVWAFAGNSDEGQQTEQALFYNGRGWTEAGKITSGQIYTASAAGPDDVWAISTTAIWHYNGSAWAKVAAPFGAGAISVLPGGGVWAAGQEKSTPVVAHWTGGSWTVTPMTRFLPGLVNLFCEPVIGAIYAQGADNVWAAGGSGCQDNGGRLHAVLHWNGRSWTALSYRGNAGQPSSMAPDGSGGLWIATVSGWPGFGGMVHVTGGQISSVALPVLDGVTPAVTLEVARGGGPVFGVGDYYVEVKDTGIAGNAIIEQR